MKAIRHLFPNLSTVLLVFVFGMSLIWWFTLGRTTETVSLSNYLYTLLEGLIPLWGGFYGLFIARKWGFFSSVFGKSISFLSLGLISWGIGTMIFVGYYNLLMGVEIPYPSLADVAYIISWPLWGVGMVYLSKTTGAKYALKNLTGKALLVVLPLIVISVSYYLLVQVARGGVFSSSDGILKVFFDLAYPIGDVVIISLATLVYGLSLKLFGGKFRFAVYILLFGFVINYFADFTFSFTTTAGTFVAGGLSDLLFTTAMFMLSLGITLLDPRQLDNKVDNQIV